MRAGARALHRRTMPTTLDKLIAAAAHLAALIGLPIVLPIAIYVWKRDEPFVADQAKQALGVQLVMCMAGVGVAVTFFVVAAVMPQAVWLVQLGMALVALLALGVMVCVVCAVLRIAEGRRYRYPVLGRLFARF
jgi:uncharacterized Tic20 family protein